MCSYPLFLWIHISDAKVIFLQQAVVVTHMIQEKLPFSVPLWKNQKDKNQNQTKSLEHISYNSEAASSHVYILTVYHNIDC